VQNILDIYMYVKISVATGEGGYKTDSLQRLNHVWDEEPLGPQPIILEYTVFLIPVRAGFDQFVAQTHLQFVTLSS
jgi:hypothetical protein